MKWREPQVCMVFSSKAILEPGRGSMCCFYCNCSAGRSPVRLHDRRWPAGGSLQQEINPVDLGASGVSNCSWVDLGSKDRREFDAYTLWKWNPLKCFVHLHSVYLSSTLEMKPEKKILGDRPAYTTPGDWNRKDGIWEDSLQGWDGEEKQGDSFSLKFAISGQFFPHTCIYFIIIIILIWKLTVCSSMYTHYLLQGRAKLGL